MGFKKQPLALAATATAGVLYIVCATFTALWPELAVKLTGWVFHIINTEKIAGDVVVTLGSFFGGLIQVLLYTYVAFWLFGWIYNRVSNMR